MSTPTPVLPPPAPDERPISEEVIALARYRVMEEATEKFKSRATWWLSIITVIAAVVIYVGLNSIKVSVTKSVTDDVRAGIDRELEPLTKRAREGMVDNEISIAKIKTESDDLHTKLDKVNEASSKLDELQDDVRKLDVRLAQINSSITSLRAAQEKLEQGRPSVFSTTFDLDKGTIEGSNFGDSPGTVSVRVAYRTELNVGMVYLPPLARTEWIPVDTASITDWSQKRITLRFSSAFKEKYKAEVSKLKLGPDDPSKFLPETYSYRIVSKTGAYNDTQ